MHQSHISRVPKYLPATVNDLHVKIAVARVFFDPFLNHLERLFAYTVVRRSVIDQPHECLSERFARDLSVQRWTAVVDECTGKL